MSTYLWIGSGLGALIGLLHALHMFRRQSAMPASNPALALWFALWTLALWTLFGAYVLTFWLIGAAGMALSRVAGKAGAGR